MDLGQFLALAVVDWHTRHGRHDLPWQNTRDPYRVWLSEIMLQQTQVVTVLGYFSRFLVRFPDVVTLAKASLDEVLSLWSGLGYYSRARNLHLCAQQVTTHYAGVFPRTARELQSLPGIGPSTAAAIASLCFLERVAILDGNVKRVLTRFLGFEADLSHAVNVRALWQQASALLPAEACPQYMPSYTQGMMDLGATLCTSKKPACAKCPLQLRCVAFAAGNPLNYPVKTRRVKRGSQTLWLLWAQSPAGAVWLSQRPAPGVWAGLYCFESFDSCQELVQSLPPNLKSKWVEMPSFKHVLTHKDLFLHPVQVTFPAATSPDAPGAWYGPLQRQNLGLPAPVSKLLREG
jgi:A/G-specific adenine glycosylase